MKKNILICIWAILIAKIPLSQKSMAAELMVNDVLISYEDSGSGDAVVFVHGAISDRRVWSEYMAPISQNRRFISYDQRFFGDSIPEDGQTEFSADTHADDLISFVEALNLEKVSLVAWSYGGDVAARATIARPDLFNAIIYYEPDINGLIQGLPGAQRATEKLYEHFGPAVEALEEGKLSDSALHFIEAVFMLEDGGAINESKEMVEVWKENGKTLPHYLSASAGNKASCRKLGDVSIPALVVVGSYGHTYDSMMAERLVECKPKAVLAKMEGVNHDGPYRKPDEFIEEIDSFLSDI